MLALALDSAAVKSFMNRLLLENFFDTHEVRAVELTLATRISIAGALEDAEDSGGYITWASLRPVVTTLIKSGPKPKCMKIVFAHPAPAQLHTNAAVLFLNLTYENDSVSFTTATSQREFALDKSIDTIWDEWVQDFFVRMGVAVTHRE